MYQAKHAVTRRLNSNTPLMVKYDSELMQRRNWLNRPETVRYRPETVRPQYRHFIKKISETCREANLPLLFVTQPTAYQKGFDPKLKSKFWMTPPFEEYTLDIDSLIQISSIYNNYLRQFTAATNNYLCDISLEIPPSSEYFLDDCHFTEKGSEVIADLILSCVIRNGVPLGIN